MVTREPSIERFRHEALFYEHTDGFVADASRYVRDGLEAGEAVLVAVIEDRAGPLREELGPDASSVEFLDMANVGRNPARIIPAWQDWVERNTALGRGFRGIGEPIWVGRSPLEIRECQMHEHLLNTAFEDGPGWGLLCPYDTRRLPGEIIGHVQASHPQVLGPNHAPVPADGGGYAGYDRHAGREGVFRTPPPPLGEPLFAADFGLGDLPRLRSAIRERADALGVASSRSLADFVLVADELASNSIRHGGGRGRLLLWREGGYAICEVRDRGLIEDPLAGRRRPQLAAGGGGAGLWSANQLCDLVLIHSTPADGTSVRAYFAPE